MRLDKIGLEHNVPDCAHRHEHCLEIFLVKAHHCQQRPLCDINTLHAPGSKTFILKLGERSFGQVATLHIFNIKFFQGLCFFPANYSDIEIGENRCQWVDIIKLGDEVPANANATEQNTNPPLTQDKSKRERTICSVLGMKTTVSNTMAVLVILSNFIGNDGNYLPSQHLGDSHIAVPTLDEIPQMGSTID